MKRLAILLSALFLLSACSKPIPDTSTESDTAPLPSEDVQMFSVLFGGTKVGDMTITTAGQQLSIDYGFDNNGRGASSQEQVTLSEQGFPVAWSIKGKTTFGKYRWP